MEINQQWGRAQPPKPEIPLPANHANQREFLTGGFSFASIRVMSDVASLGTRAIFQNGFSRSTICGHEKSEPSKARFE
jgi:hypothetical protein